MTTGSERALRSLGAGLLVRGLLDDVAGLALLVLHGDDRVSPFEGLIQGAEHVVRSPKFINDADLVGKVQQGRIQPLDVDDVAGFA